MIALNSQRPGPMVARDLDLLLAGFNPLLKVADACFLLDDCSPDHVVRLIDCGKLRAVDIRTPQASQRAIRIYRYTVEHLKLRPDLPLCWIDPEEIFIHSRDTWLRREVQALLSCSDDHVRNLALPGPRYSGGRNGMHRVNATALAEFLREREIQ